MVPKAESARKRPKTQEPAGHRAGPGHRREGQCLEGPPRGAGCLPALFRRPVLPPGLLRTPLAPGCPGRLTPPAPAPHEDSHAPARLFQRRLREEQPLRKHLKKTRLETHFPECSVSDATLHGWTEAPAVCGWERWVRGGDTQGPSEPAQGPLSWWPVPRPATYTKTWPANRPAPQSAPREVKSWSRHPRGNLASRGEF